MDITKMLRQIFEQRDRRRPAVHEDPALAVRENFALEQQFALFRLEPRLFEDSRCPVWGIEDARNAGSVLPGPDHLGRCSATQQKTQRVNDDGFPAPRFSGEQIQTRVKPYSEAIHYGIVLNHQLVKHSIRL